MLNLSLNCVLVSSFFGESIPKVVLENIKKALEYERKKYIFYVAKTEKRRALAFQDGETNIHKFWSKE